MQCVKIRKINRGGHYKTGYAAYPHNVDICSLEIPVAKNIFVIASFLSEATINIL
jgi:hypothetical protein